MQDGSDGSGGGGVSVTDDEVRRLAQALFRVAKGEQERSGKRFGELADDWLERTSKRRVDPSNEERHLRYLAPLRPYREGELTKRAIEALFGELLKPRGSLGPATLNKVRSVGALVIDDAVANADWQGANPFRLVARLPEPEPAWVTLTVAEARAALAHLRPDRRWLVHATLLVGLRPGEAFALRKVDLDLVNRVMHVHRSHGRAQTKTGRPRRFPIPDRLLPTLRESMASAPGSEYVFPAAGGGRHPSWTRLTNTLRRALGDGGVVNGYRHYCTRTGCGFREVLEAEVHLRCPKCRRTLLVQPVPKAVRFYDLRHSAATLHRRAGCDPLVIQLVLGHTPGNTTDAIYTHLDEDYMRRELNKLEL